MNSFVQKFAITDITVHTAKRVANCSLLLYSFADTSRNTEREETRRGVTVGYL